MYIIYYRFESGGRAGSGRRFRRFLRSFVFFRSKPRILSWWWWREKKKERRKIEETRTGTEYRTSIPFRLDDSAFNVLSLPWRWFHANTATSGDVRVASRCIVRHSQGELPLILIRRQGTTHWPCPLPPRARASCFPTETRMQSSFQKSG